MDRRALIIGGTGQIGRAAAALLANDGWDVTITSRRPPVENTVQAVWNDGYEVSDNIRFRLFDRDDTNALREATEGSDLVVDAVAYEEHHADQLVGLGASIGSLIVISTGSVAIDPDGYTFDEATGPDKFPRFPVPMTENHPTIDKDLTKPENRTYSALKAEIERRVLACTTTSVTVLRPGAIYGPHSYALREWYFIKRALDGRAHTVLADEGKSVFNTSSAANIAALIRLAAETPGTGIVNAVDEDYLTTAEIGQTIFDLMGHDGKIATFSGPPRGDLGRSPWGIPHPLIMDMTKASVALGYVQPAGYWESVSAAVDWVRELRAASARRGEDWLDDFPGLGVERTKSWFNYELEDQHIAESR